MAVDANTGQPIYPGAPAVGLRNVGSYQVSGEPWITGSQGQAHSKVKRYVFPFVTREVSIATFEGSSANTQIWVHFASGSGQSGFSSTVDIEDFDGTSDVYLGRHYVAITSGSQSVTFRAKVKEIYVATPAHNDGGAAVGYRVLADLTNVPTKRMYHLTGSGHTEASSG
tara:strand:+ start:929 stop:1435 length:507 start_codon:yes stop_codon:yes gene_type:complete